MMIPSSDRNLLFGMVAYQNSYITFEQFVDAAEIWYKNPAQNIADILVDKKYIDDTERFNIEGIVEDRLRRQGGIDDSLGFLIRNWSIPDSQDLPEEWQNRIQEISQVSGPSQVNGNASPGQTPELGGVDRYVFHKVIGEGGQGIVWEVHDNQLGRRVALKKVKPTCTRKPLYSDMLIKEARKTGCINHTGAVPVHDIGQDEDGSPYFTMQLVRGERLTDRLKSVKYDGMSSREFLSAIRPLLRNIIDVCNTLQFAYDQNGIIHRDIKPDNIMVDRYGETLILDWGMGKAVEDKSKLDDASTVLFTPASGEPNEETQAGSIKGTLAYMSPEQAQAMSALLDHRTDVYLVGATLYRILVGRPPHQGGEWEMVRLAAANEFTSPRQINPLVPEELEAICLKAMKTRPEDRYENATALADDLENWLADEPVSVAPEGVLKKSERWLRRNSKGVVASLIGLTATTLLLAVFSQLLWKAERQARDSRNIASSVLDDTVGYVIDDVLSGIPNTDDKRIKILEGVIESVEKNSASHSGDQVLNLDLLRLLTRLYIVQTSYGNDVSGTHRKRAEEIQERVYKLMDHVSQGVRRKNDTVNLLAIRNDFNSVYAINLMLQNKMDKALEITNDIENTSAKLLKLEPNSEPAVIQGSKAIELRGSILVENNKAQDAIPLFDKSIDSLSKMLRSKLSTEPSKPMHTKLKNPKNELYMFLFLDSATIEKGKALASMKKYDEAEQTLQSAIQISKNLQMVDGGASDGRNNELTCYVQLHSIYLALNKIELAKKQIEQATELVSNNPEDSDLIEIFNEWVSKVGT